MGVWLVPLLPAMLCAGFLIGLWFESKWWTKAAVWDAERGGLVKRGASYYRVKLLREPPNG